MNLNFKKLQPKGNSYDGSSRYTEKTNHTLIIIGTFLIIIIVIVLIVYNVSKANTCNKIEKTILEQAEIYAQKNNLLPTLEGDSITLNIDDIYFEIDEKPMFKEKICSGTIKFTKYKNEYIKTYDITDCGYCSTEKRYKNWSKETSKKPSSKLLTDVTAYYNYYGVEFYHSSWSNWISEDEIGETDETYHVALPIKKNNIPKIPAEANIIEYEKEDATWYRYRDKKWKYYKDNGGTYSNLSSEQVEGFTNKDTSTEMKTEWTEWSLDYPEVKSYRSIKTSTGYRWYYIDGDTKIYWNSGAYYPKQPSEEYNKKEKETVKMYSYQDKMWKWYNGKKRSYTGFVSEQTSKYYPNRDNDLIQYSNWTNYSSEKKLDSSNSWYREEETKTYSRYRISYSMKSFLKLDSYVTKEEFEQTLQGTLEDINKRTDIQIDIDYKFKYRKK